MIEEGKEMMEEEGEPEVVEEEAADKKLTQLGEGGINEAAAMAGAGVEEE